MSVSVAQGIKLRTAPGRVRYTGQGVPYIAHRLSSLNALFAATFFGSGWPLGLAILPATLHHVEKVISQ